MRTCTLFLLVSIFLWEIDVSRAQDKAVADTVVYLESLKNEMKVMWPENRTINIVFHGHSGPGGSWHNHEVNTLESYPHQVLENLKKVYPYAVINVIVTAIGGENALQGAKRFKGDVLVHNPDVLVIDYSGNDIALGLETSKLAWEEMIKEAIAHKVKVILVTPGYDQRVDILQPGNPYQLHAEQIRQLAVTYGVALADPFRKVQQIARSGESLLDYMSHVNHFNARGHAIYCAEIMKWFMP